MRRKTNDIDAIMVLGLLLIIPLIFYWRLVLTVCIIVIILKIVCSGLKRICKTDTIQNVDTNSNTVLPEKISDFEYHTNKINIYEHDKYMIKGLEAEQKNVRILKKIFNASNVIHDSYFRDDELVTTQVDVIVVDDTGIYVFESKAYSGVIKGKQKDKIWVQLFSNKKYNRFSNPIIQNDRHVEAVKKNLAIFDLPEQAFKSYIVFADNCKLDLELEPNCSAKIIQQKDVFYTLLAEKKSSPSVIATSKVEEISRRINAHANIGDEIKMAHIDRRKNNVRYTQSKD